MMRPLRAQSRDSSAAILRQNARGRPANSNRGETFIPMMEALRRGAGSWVAKILLFVLIISFAVWGVADVFTGYGQRSLARIGETEISADEFQNAYQNEISALSSRLGRRLTPEQARAFGIDSRVLSRLIGSAAIDTHAHQLGLAFPDAEVASAIRSDPAFKGMSGGFDRSQFNELLRQNGISEARYFTERKSAGLREQITETLLGDIVPPSIAVDVIHRYRGETRTISYFTLDPEKSAKTAEPDEAKLKEYYEQNKRSFVAPEYRKLNVLLLTTDVVKKLVPVTDEEVKDHYERNKAKFNDPEKRRVQQLSFPDMAAAEKAYAALSTAKSFEEKAQELGFKESDYDLGLLARSDLIDPSIAEAAFSLEKGKMSKPIAGQFTTAIVRVLDIQPGRQRTFEDVKAQIADELAGERSGREIQSLHDKIDDERGAGKPLKEIADQLHLKFVAVDATDRAGKTPQNQPAFEHAEGQKLAASGFEGEVGFDRETIELEDGYAWVEVVAVTPERQKPFEEVAEDVKRQWLEAERKKALAAAAQALVERIDKGDKPEAVAKELGLKLETSQPFKRSEPVAALTQTGARQVFALANGKAASVETPDGKSRSVVVVTQITPPPAPSKEQSERISAELTRQLQSDLLSEYVAALQTRFGVSVNDAVLKRTLGLDRQ
jgi:peptidyl-prolyl cis-trans isomerase D